MLLMIDNYDSFTYNLVQYLGELGQDVQVHRNDEIDLHKIAQLKPKYIVISPGPCTPNEAGISLALIKEFAGKIPLLGVCLGHQSIGQAFSGNIIKAKTLMHGKTSLIHHTSKGVFKDLPNPYTATRYHSLVIERETIPDCRWLGCSADRHIEKSYCGGGRERQTGCPQSGERKTIRWFYAACRWPARWYAVDPI